MTLLADTRISHEKALSPPAVLSDADWNARMTSTDALDASLPADRAGTPSLARELFARLEYGKDPPRPFVRPVEILVLSPETRRGSITAGSRGRRSLTQHRAEYVERRPGSIAVGHRESTAESCSSARVLESSKIIRGATDHTSAAQVTLRRLEPSGAPDLMARMARPCRDSRIGTTVCAGSMRALRSTPRTNQTRGSKCEWRAIRNNPRTSRAARRFLRERAREPVEFLTNLDSPSRYWTS